MGKGYFRPSHERMTSFVYKSTVQLYNFGMSDFHDFYFGMSADEREAYVKRAGTSIGYVERVAGGFALPSLRMAVRLVRAARKKIGVESIVRTYEERSGSLA